MTKPTKKKLIKAKISKEEHDQAMGELTADLQRVQADFANFKRRSEEDRVRALGLGKEAVLTQLLPVVDNLQRALGNVPKELAGSDYIKGIEAVSKSLVSSLEKQGLEQIEALGREFDANLMEAVVMEDGDGDKEIVSEVLQPGYKLGEQVLRYATVKVKKGK